MTRLLAAAALLLGAASPSSSALILGVNVHFEQGWPLAAYAKVEESGARAIRETVTWGKVEVSPGRYDFTARNSRHIDVACARSIPVLIDILPRNKLYDGGMAVFSPTGQRALGRYVGALVDRFPCVIGIEVGNEINTASANWPSRANKPAMYVSMLRAVRTELDRGTRRVALVGGSSIGVDVPFHERLFAAGELPLIDAVAVHPYIDNPDRLPDQFARLRQAMVLHGSVKPVWATEFGNYYKTPEAAPPHAIKLMTVMSASGIAQAYWYALLDEPWYPNMGLYGAAGAKPALLTFQLVIRQLLSAGDAQRIPTLDPALRVYRFGQGPYVIWGAGRPIRLPANVSVFDPTGRSIAAPTVLGADPIVVKAPAGIHFD